MDWETWSERRKAERRAQKVVAVLMGVVALAVAAPFVIRHHNMWQECLAERPRYECQALLNGSKTP